MMTSKYKIGTVKNIPSPVKNFRYINFILTGAPRESLFCFTDKKIRFRLLSNSPKVTQLVSDRAKIQTQCLF